MSILTILVFIWMYYYVFYFILIRNQNWNRKVCYIRVCLSRCVCVSTEQLPHQLILPKAFFLSTILSPMKSIYNCHFRMLNWYIAWSPNLLLGPWHVRESAGRMSEVEACPVCRAGLLPALSEPEWLTMTSRYQLSWCKMAAARHISIPPLLTTSAPFTLAPTLHYVVGVAFQDWWCKYCTRKYKPCRNLYVSIHRSKKIFPFKTPICNTLLYRRHYCMFILCIYLRAQRLQKWRNTKTNEDSGRSALFVWTGWILESKLASSLSSTSEYSTGTIVHLIYLYVALRNYKNYKHKITWQCRAEG